MIKDEIAIDENKMLAIPLNWYVVGMIINIDLMLEYLCLSRYARIVKKLATMGRNTTNVDFIKKRQNYMVMSRSLDVSCNIITIYSIED